MMKFRTEINIQTPDFRLSHSDKIMMMGSCFVENISPKIVLSGFRADVNPFGIVYNPVSIATGLADLMDGKNYTESELFEYQGIYHSFAHHGRFSGTDKDAVLEQIRLRINQSAQFLKETSLLILTLGTANVYRLAASGEVVANCHKLPAKLFREERLTIGEITLKWNELINRLQMFRPGLKLLFTVSPIRHRKDGAHENRLSKATLLLAVDELTKTCADCYYFPSYELMMDDLRDYRFYAEDMIHPSGQAVDYIWEKFAETYFDSKTRDIIKEWENIRLALNHRPFNPESEEYKTFREKTEQRKAEFLTDHPSFRYL